MLIYSVFEGPIEKTLIDFLNNVGVKQLCLSGCFKRSQTETVSIIYKLAKLSLAKLAETEGEK